MPMSDDNSTEAFLSMGPSADREELYWRLATSFRDIYESLGELLADIEGLEREVGGLFQRDDGYVV